MRFKRFIKLKKLFNTWNESANFNEALTRNEEFAYATNTIIFAY